MLLHDHEVSVHNTLNEMHKEGQRRRLSQKEIMDQMVAKRKEMDNEVVTEEALDFGKSWHNYFMFMRGPSIC